MKVLKFGGTSVGTAQSLRMVKSIVEGAQEDVIVVVSALSGVTDELISIGRKAEKGQSYKSSLDKLRKRHFDVVDDLFPKGDNRRIPLMEKIASQLERLGKLYAGVNMLHILPQDTLDEIVSYGERMSSNIVTALIDGAERVNSLDVIKTNEKNGKNIPDFPRTNALLKEAFKDFGKKWHRAVMPGFIATDLKSGRTTTLGRGGSDYTASIVAAGLGASILEIWTDVDGFMTADPRIIKTSYVINELSFRDAMELCNFGAKVIYPPTLYPVRTAGIPILVKNTFNPSAPGTIIKEKCAPSSKPITGISSINDTSLITLSGNSMVGIVGVDARIFGCLAKNDISAFLVCQSSSETGISIGVRSEEADKAQKLISKEFAHEIKLGAINQIQIIPDLATVAIVGEHMRRNAGLAGKLFSTLGRGGINVMAFAQGTDETNISFVVERKYLRKSLNLIHDSFFLSEFQELNLFICGIGTVGGQLMEQIAQQQDKLKKERNLKLNIVGIARSTKGIFDRSGIDLTNFRERLEKEGIDITPAKLKDEIINMNIFNPVFVDCTASADVATIYQDLLEHSVNVVAANKVAASGDYDNYCRLKETARKKGVKYKFETNVGAGLPIIGTINDLVNSGDKIEKIEAVVSGTLNFIFNTISEEIPFSKTVKMAQEAGYAEPDPRIDLSGKDVMRKLVILSREAGYKVSMDDIKANLFIPQDFFECSMDEFWQKLPSLDADFEARRKVLEKNNERWRFVAKMENGEFSVSLRTVDSLHSFYVLDGSNNIILLTTERYHEHPMLIQGYGAGASVTAAGVFADIMSIANIR